MSRIGGKERVIPASTASEEHTATSADMLSALPLSFILSGIVSYAYLFFTIGCSIGFVLLISEYTTNDHWWREFNTTGGHTFVADVFNTRINMGQLGDFDLFASSLPKDYSTPNTFIDMRPTSVRKILLSSIPLEKVVTTIRTNGLYENIFTIIPYCWVDFSHRFEMAHTAKRQLRCALRQYDNAAVHLETLARNVDPTDWAQSSYGVQINQIIFSAVVQTTEGSAWLAALNAHKWGAVSDEVAFWQQNGLTRFTIQSQNRFLLGYENTITVVNALGVGRWMTTHSVPFIVAGLATWTTKQIAAGLWNDLTKCVTFGCTLLRNKNNSLEALGRNWDTTYMGSAQNTSGDLAREFLGPLVNWDTYYVAPPASLVDVVVKFQGQLYNRLQTDSAFSSVYESIKEVDIDVTPPGWDEIGISYFGGNPLCAPLAQAKPYIQMPFSFDDACQVQERFSIRFGRLGVLFSAWVSQLALSDVGTVCNCSDIHAMYCNDIFASAQNLVSDFIKPSNIQTIVQDIRSLNLLFIQFATQNTTKRLLTQPVVQSPNDQWSAFGWITLFDWVDGTREAFNFEGDTGNLTLLSAASSYLPLAPKSLELPQTACRYFRYMALYFTFISFGTALVILMYAFVNKFHGEARNLFQFNRVVGSIWIGRPLLFLRGLTAILILSTSPTILTKQNSMTFFLNSPRSLIIRLLLCGESLWISYVLNDALLPISNPITKKYATLNAILSFVATFWIEHQYPIQVQATVSHECKFTSFRRGAVCQGGHVNIGDFTRVQLLVFVQIMCLLSSLVMIYIFEWCFTRRKLHTFQMHNPDRFLVPAAANAFFITSHDSSYPLDSIACVMSGLLPLPSSHFNFNIWDLVTKDFECGKEANITNDMSSNKPKSSPQFTWRNTAIGYASLLYMAGSIVGSFAFLQLTRFSMENDFWWALFDVSTQTYLGNFYNQNLQYMNATTSIDITAPEFGALAAITNTTVMTVAVAPLSAIAVHDVSNSLANVIEGLRRMDGCQVPWIMTIYCYVDFKRQWEMAPTQSMQDRCKNDQNNGAIYLESLLRNADAESLSDCWGQSLEIAVFSYLKSFANGKEWLSDTKSSKLSVSDEVKYWLASNLTRYTTQWQNYKSLGVAEFFFIQNAFGLTYPLTLKYLNSSFQLSVQTSFKMQWPLAQILTAILSNASALSGKSLIRMSPMYAFVNSTSEDALVSAGVLSSPLGPSLSLVRNLLGPFGSVSMRRVAVPNLLREWYQNVSFEMMKFLSSSRDIQSAYWPAYTSTTIAPRPRAWEGATLGGGNIMCDVAVATMTGTLPGVFYSSTGSCGVNVQEFFVHETSMWLMVFLATGPVNITALVQMETRNPASTKVNLILSTAFFKGYFPNDKYLVLHQQAQTVQALIANESRISIAQFLRRGSELSLSIFPLFNETEPDFDFFSWLYLFDWVQGQREVVSFEGGNSTVALMSSMTPFGGVEANPAEMPTNVAYLMRWLMQYITWVLLFVACIVCIYILRVRGHVEGSNMVSFTRVASLVWLGRPLIFVRAIAALCLLSTSSLVLERPLNGLISHLTAAPQPWYTIILAAGELNWIVYIINDIFSVVTNEYTQMYSFLCYLAVWVASAILSFVSPPSVSVSIERVCSVAQVDFQVECHSGTVVIGSLRQLLVLLGLVLGLCTICFSIVRVFYRKLLFKDSRSLFLYAAARHQFRMTNWEYNDMVFLDKASAVLTGLLSIEFGDTLYVFDIKTWRMHGCPLHQTTSDMGDLPTHLMHAVPLVDL